MRKSIVRAAIAAAGLLSAVSFASAAQADTYNITGYGLPNAVNGNIIAPSIANPNGEGAQIGGINFYGSNTTTNTNGITLAVFCVDVADILKTGTFQGYDVTTNNGVLGYTSAELDNVGYLLNQFYTNSIGNTVASAALQLAIWEVLNESVGNLWNVKTGAFRVTNYDSYDLAATGGVDDTANSYLGNLTTALGAPGGVGHFNVTLLSPISPTDNQTQILATVTRSITPPGTGVQLGVPEPATWGMIVLGFGLLGSALRRRKQEELFA